MTSLRIARLVVMLSVVVPAFAVTAQAGSPGRAPAPSPQIAVVGSPSLVSAPVLNNNQAVLTSGPTLTLPWTAPATGSATSYLVEASSTPGGSANLGSLNTGTPQTTLVVPGVPVGTYYVRVRGVDASGAGAPSNEVQVVVSTSSISAPVLNNNVPVLNSGTTLTLSWTTPQTGFPTSYLVEASATPGGPANLASYPTGNTLTTLVVPGVPPGTYYLRVRGADATGVGAPSNEVQVVVATVGGGTCPSAPRGLNIVAQSGGAVTLGWQPPLTGVAASYVVQVGTAPGLANLANFDTDSVAVSLSASGVAAGSYFIRIYAKSSDCAPPAFIGPASNEILLSVGGTPGWSGQIECGRAISGTGYGHNETQTWFVSGPGQVSGPRTTYPTMWTAHGFGHSAATPSGWTINSTVATDFSVTIRASDQIPLFDRTTAAILVRGGLVATPNPFDLYEIDFPTFFPSSPTATTVSGTYSRPTVGGDSPQQPGDATGTLTCSWSFRKQ